MKPGRQNFWQGLLITILIGVLTLVVTDYCQAQTKLTIGVPYSDSLSSDGEEKFYKVNMPAGEHLFVLLDKGSGWYSDLLIRYNALPDGGYDDKGWSFKSLCNM